MNTTEMRENALGHFVPVSQIKEIDLLRNEVVMELVQEGKELQAQMAAFKVKAMSKIADFVDLSASEYSVKYGGAKGNVTLVSFDGKYKLMRAVGEHRIFDERIQAAKAQIDECIQRWNEGSDDKIKALVEHAFRVNKQGHIDVNQVLSLRQLNIEDAEWTEAMDAIADSIKITGTSSYLRLYERDGNGKYVQIPLDPSKL
ncbi:sulfate transporter [Vibrio galatheae]|uniref:Sulfate transporter n=1 Tax=Vibrio galatheae TaxID=579748 RepID=A0A0F4NK96_9VIBR|nr:DUF3164 family protein [Vibrio galatheae]KJY83298.1 sulfate transporter [Vibrio galatheae]